MSKHVLVISAAQGKAEILIHSAMSLSVGYRNPEIRRRRFFWPVERLDIVSDAVSVTPPISVFKG